MLWGRLAYDKRLSDDVFKKHLAQRFPQVSSETLFKAWALASRPLPKVQELTQGSWGLDAHWYAEASLYPENRKGFRYLDDFIATTVARTSSSDLCSIADSAAGKCGTKKSSYQLADEMEADLARGVSQHLMAIGQVHPKHSVGQCLLYHSFDFDRLFLSHIGPLGPDHLARIH